MQDQTTSAPIGNADLAWRDKTAFLCSTAIPERVSEAVFSWVDSLSPENDCVICGNLQKIEVEVVDRLLGRGVPTIVVLPGPFPALWPLNMMRAVGERRLLVVTASEFELPWVDKYDKASARNRYILDNARDIVVGYCTPGGKLAAQIEGRKNVRLLTEFRPEDMGEIVGRGGHAAHR